MAGNSADQTLLSCQWRRGIHFFNGLRPSRGRNIMEFSLFDRRCLFGLCCVVLRNGDDHRSWIFLRGGTSCLCPCDGDSGLGGLGVLLRTRCSLFFSALVRQHAMVLNGTSPCFATSSVRSSPRAFSSSHGRICNILALSRTTLSLSSACIGICILRMVLG